MTASIIDAAPLPPQVTMEPKVAKAGDALTCAIAAPATDPDGDRVKYEVKWEAPKGVKIIRKTPEGLKDVPVPLKEMMEGKNTSDIALQTEDVLFVPASAGKNAARRTLEAIVQTATGMAVYRR